MTVKEARSLELSDRLEALAYWCKSRREGNHDPDTTITMLRKKVSELVLRVDRAGQNSHLPRCYACGMTVRETPTELICNNCGQRKPNPTL